MTFDKILLLVIARFESWRTGSSNGLLPDKPSLWEGLMGEHEKISALHNKAKKSIYVVKDYDRYHWKQG